MELEKLKQKRVPMRTGFTKTANSLEEELKKDSPNINDVMTLMAQLQEKGKKLEEVDETVLLKLLEDGCSQEIYDVEYEAIEKYKDRSVSLMVKSNQLLLCSNQNQRQQTETHSVPRKYRLPELELKKFSGELRDWLGFWGQFKRIDEDPDIGPEDKFQYLLQATTVGSRARLVVESFPPTAESYPKAVDSLKTRFGKDDTLVEVYVRELLRLVLNNALNPHKKVVLTTLYDKLESQLRALETLGVTIDKYAAMLYPLVESCLPEDVLRTWERSRGYASEKKDQTDCSSAAQKRLDQLMQFLRGEVDGEERIHMARSGFGFGHEMGLPRKQARKPDLGETASLPTASGLFSGNQNITKTKEPDRCIFCEGTHASEDCRQVDKLTLDDKKKILSQKGCCFSCLRLGHLSRKCRRRPRCPTCGRSHFSILCPECHGLKIPATSSDQVSGNAHSSNDHALSNQACTADILLQTLVVQVQGRSGMLTARVLIDTGSQRSYVSVDLARRLDLVCEGQVTIAHSLFGGEKSEPREHKRYRVHVISLQNDYRCNFEVLDQPLICGPIPKIPTGLCISELREKQIRLSDYEALNDQDPASTRIDILIGADVAGKLFTGRVYILKSGPVAVETNLGWTLMGKLPQVNQKSNTVALVTSLYVRESTVSDLWKLDCLGITDPVESITRQEMQEAAFKHFRQTIKRDEQGRYEVCLPWIEGHPPLEDNRFLAEKRLKSTTKKLHANGTFQDYQEVLDTWETENIIEEVREVISTTPQEPVHYLPHRAVVRDASKTTRIRPVFDASARSKNTPSLNDCLETGPNLIEQIPAVLTRFRMQKVGVVSDIRKAFLQISIAEKDRDFLRFLWWEKAPVDAVKVYRHRRVVFGISSSPFLLSATLRFHLENSPEHLRDTAEKLKDSLYVDNCVSSVENERHLNQFIQESQELLHSAMFELHEWTSNVPNCSYHNANSVQDSRDENGTSTPVLGLLWNSDQDTLGCDVAVKELNGESVTKRQLLSMANRIFDPLGFSCPVTLLPKLLLQEIWKLPVGWDDALPDPEARQFLLWVRQIPLLESLKIPRHLGMSSHLLSATCLHVFCDASRKAYAACIFVRVESKQGVTVQLVRAKARVAPLKTLTIPRLELMACCIGCRLANTVKNDMQILNLPTFFWTDSTNALCWIKREEIWGTFVGNRVKEIRSLSAIENWHHISGEQNPADLPSRGCSAEQLTKSSWWEGPNWLKQSIDQWPKAEMITDEEIINLEKKRTVSACCEKSAKTQCYSVRFSSFPKTVRVIAWIFRFAFNAKRPLSQKIKGGLVNDEILKAEKILWKLVQCESFQGMTDTRLRSLPALEDHEGVLRVKTGLFMRQDEENFKSPIVLPSNHPVVHQLIFWRHKELCHAGLHSVMSDLREKYWILQGRKTVRKVLQQCGRCRRFTAGKIEVLPAPLPEDRVCDAAVFQISGVDLAGPLFLKGGIKSWIVLFACAVYRAVHLELVTSLSTEAFLQALRRFVSRRGRPSVVYSDNGTNFIGTVNAFKQVDWNSVQTYTATKKITWKFNPPSAPWWGGWWERLIGMIKQLLRRVLGRASLQYEELTTILCDCESVVNSRPLTYLSENTDDLAPLTPALFLQDVQDVGVPEIDVLDEASINKRARYKNKIRQSLRQRFRTEYLGQLRQRNFNKKKQSTSIKPGQVVLVGEDNTKRMDWRLARVIQIYPGRDGEVRVARAKTANGEFMRPVPKLYLLEMNDDDLEKQELQNLKQDEATPHDGQNSNKEFESPKGPTAFKTRSGRLVKAPDRLYIT